MIVVLSCRTCVYQECTGHWEKPDLQLFESLWNWQKFKKLISKAVLALRCALSVLFDLVADMSFDTTLGGLGFVSGVAIVMTANSVAKLPYTRRTFLPLIGWVHQIWLVPSIIVVLE